MVNINTVFADYLKADDLGGIDGEPVLATIQEVTVEKMKDGEQKLCLKLIEYDRGLLLNKTNTNNIAAFAGPETDEWRGKRIVLYVAMVDFQGKSTEAIRVRQPKQQPKQPVTPAPQQDHGDLNDRVPF